MTEFPDAGLDPAEYRRTGLAVLRQVFDAQSVELMSSYASLLGHLDTLSVEQRQVPGSLVRYGDPFFDTVMASLAPLVTAGAATPVVPTYSYLRLYFNGQDLTPHRDRPACEHSITLNIARSSPAAWPIHLLDSQGDEQVVELGEGDAVMYQGWKLSHWREPCPIDWYLQVFLHFVEVDGPHSSEQFDGRPYLGLPRKAPAHGA